MATVTRPAIPLPNPGDDIDAEQVRDWINNILSFLESTNIDEANVDLTGADGIVGKSTSQTITGFKTFETTAAAAGGVREVAQFGVDPASGTPTDNDGGRFVLYMDNDAGVEKDIVNLDWVFSDTASGSEDSRFEIRSMLAGTLGTVYSGGYNSSAAGSHTFTVRDTAAASTLDSFVFQWDPDSGTALDNQGVALAFKMADDAGVQTQFATIDVVATDVSDTTEDAKFVFNVITDGSDVAALTVDGTTVAVPNDLTVGGSLTLTGGITLNGNVTVGDSASDTLTVNSTVTSNLIFTDNTYDIGASGATRPRNLYLSGNGVVGGTLGVTGLITATGGVSGALTGNVTGNLTGDVTGNISGNVTGGTISGTTGTFSGDVAVNTSTLKVDTGNNRVGVKNASPSYPLDIGYTAGINQVAWRGSTNEIGFLTYGSSTDAGALQLSSGGAAKILFDAAGNSYINTESNFGIGTASPSAKLTVDGGDILVETVRLGENPTSTNNGEFSTFSTGAVTVGTGASSTVDLFTRQSSAASAAGTVYVSCESAGGVRWGYIIDFFHSNSTFTTTSRETGNSQGTTTCTIQENSAGVSVTVTYAGGIGANISYNAGGHASILDY